MSGSLFWDTVYNTVDTYIVGQWREIGNLFRKWWQTIDLRYEKKGKREQLYRHCALIGDRRLALFGHVRRTLARSSASVCWTARRHHISPWLEEKTRKTKKQLAAWCSQGQGHTSHCTRGLDSGWWSRRMESAAVLCRLRVLMMMIYRRETSLHRSQCKIFLAQD